MKKLALLLLMILTLAGCDSPQNTVKSLSKDIEAFRASPNDQIQMTIEQSFAKLDQQISSLENQGKSQDASLLRSQESSLRGDYAAAKIARSVNDAKNAIQGFGNAFKEAGKSIGDVFRESTNSSE